MKTKVIYRYWRGDVIALFPEKPGNMSPYTCASYQHIGQHGTAPPALIILHSRPARPEEYASLHEELTNIGYDLQVIKRHTRAHLEARKAELRRMRA